MGLVERLVAGTIRVLTKLWRCRERWHHTLHEYSPRAGDSIVRGQTRVWYTPCGPPGQEESRVPADCQQLGNRRKTGTARNGDGGRRIAWRLQAQAEGDLSDQARRRAMDIANDADLRIRAP